MPQTLVHHSADGSIVTDLTALVGTTGRLGPPETRVTVTPIAARPGSIPTVVDRPGRTLVLPTLFKTADVASLFGVIRSLTEAVGQDTRTSYGKIVSTAHDGVIREISALYLAGLDVAEDLPTSAIAALVFRCPHPFWRETTDQTIGPFVAGGDTGTFFDPPGPTVAWLPDWYLEDSDLTIAASVTNSGEHEAWPVWTINGPMTGVLLTNTTTGRVFDLDHTLAAGESVTIDTRPGAKTVVDGMAANLWGSVDQPDMWPLAPGANALTLAGTGMTGAASISGTFRREYSSA